MIDTPSSDQPIVSIITPTLNHARYIQDTLDSVASQDYPHIQYIVMDGASTDGTLEIVQAVEEGLTLFSEADLGQAHAINKALAHAKGDIVCWLNSDDLLAPGAIARVVRFFQQNPDAMFVYGYAIAINSQNMQFGIRRNIAPCDFDALVRWGDFIVQPAAFFRRKLVNEIGMLDADLHFCFDYEYWMRASKAYPLHHVPDVLAYERLHPQAKTTQGSLKRLDELEQVAIRHGGSGVPALFLPEWAAVMLIAALRYGVRGKFGQAWALIRQVVRQRFNLLTFLLHFGALLIFGTRGTVTLRLISNYLHFMFSPRTAAMRTSLKAFKRANEHPKNPA